MHENFYTSELGKVFLSTISKAKNIKTNRIDFWKTLKHLYGQQFSKILTNKLGKIFTIHKSCLADEVLSQLQNGQKSWKDNSQNTMSNNHIKMFDLAI